MTSNTQPEPPSIAPRSPVAVTENKSSFSPAPESVSSWFTDLEAAQSDSPDAPPFMPEAATPTVPTHITPTILSSHPAPRSVTSDHSVHPSTQPDFSSIMSSRPSRPPRQSEVAHRQPAAKRPRDSVSSVTHDHETTTDFGTRVVFSLFKPKLHKLNESFAVIQSALHAIEAAHPEVNLTVSKMSFVQSDDKLHIKVSVQFTDFVDEPALEKLLHPMRDLIRVDKEYYLKMHKASFAKEQAALRLKDRAALAMNLATDALASNRATQDRSRGSLSAAEAASMSVTIMRDLERPGLGSLAPR